MKKIVFFLQLLFSFLNALEYTPYEEIAYGSEPRSFVGGCVNVITGDYVVREYDWVVQGHEPIPIERRHLSSRAKDDKWSGWEFFFKHLKAQRVVVGSSVSYADREKVQYDTYQIVIPEKYGFSLAYKGTFLKENPNGEYKIVDEYPHALTNCYAKEIGGRYSAFNNRVYTDPKNNNVIKVDGPGGLERAYECLGNKEDFYLRWERLPNGNFMHYQWLKINNVYRLKRVVTTDATGKKTYAWIEVEHIIQDDNLQSIKIKTSDAQSLVYRIVNKKGPHITFWTLEKVESSSIPSVKYEYWGNKKEGYFVCDRYLPEGRRLRIDYYLKGDNLLSRGNIKIKRCSDKKIMRVKRLALPLLEEEELQTVFEFYYHPGDYIRKGGRTTVIDPYGYSTRYCYNEHFLLTTITHHSKNDNVFSEEAFEWKEYQRDKGHWLKGKAFKDDQGNTLRKTQYIYDNKGNVTQEILRGDLTGFGNFNESYIVERTYNSMNLVTQENFPNGKSIEYHYVPHTDLVDQKYILDRGVIKIRNIFVYEGSVLKRKVIDDGSQKNPQDLTGVTCRVIVDIHPKTVGSFLDFPAEIEEKYLDLKTGEEKLLRKCKIQSYTPFGKPEEVIHYDDEGNERYTIHYSYDNQGRLASTTDPMGRIKIFKYDQNDQIILESNPDYPYEIENTYSVAGLLTTKQEKDRITRFSYDFLGRKQAEIDFRATVTRHIYDPFGHPIQDISPAVVDFEGEIKNPQIKRVFNALGHPIREEDAEGNITQTFYTSRGKPYRIIYPDGVEESFRYNLEGELALHIQPSGTQTHFTYDFLNRMTSKKVVAKEGEILAMEHYEYDSFNLKRTIAPDGVETDYTYDGGGRKIQEKTLDRTQSFRYDALGRKSKEKEGNLRVTHFFYDLLDRVLEEREEDVEGNVYAFTRYTYDDYSNKIAISKEVQVGDAIHRTEYDSFKRITKIIDPEGNKTTTSYDDYYENSLGQKVLRKTTTHPNGTYTVEEYDALERLVSLQKKGADGTPLLDEKFFYDLNGNKRRQESILDGSGTKIIKIWKYDARGRVIALIEAPGDLLQKETTYSYTPDGYLEVLTKPDRTTVSYSYDGLGRQTAVKTSEGTCHYLFKYDLMGNLIESFDGIHKRCTIRKYDHFGNLLQETLANHLTLDSTYDALNRRTRLTFPDGSFVNYIYDPYHLICVQRFQASRELLYEHVYSDYDQSHNLLQEELLGSLGSIYHRIDLCSRRIATDTPYSLEEILDIDPNGNVKEYYRLAESKEEFYTFAHDDLDQLISETGPIENDYTYDSHHNRLEKNLSEYAYNSLHQIVSTSEATYTHDPNGNRTEWITPQQIVSYTYDGLDRLVQMRLGDHSIRFTYDSWNRSHTQALHLLKDGAWLPIEETPYLYDGQNEIGAYPHELRILGQGKGAEIGATLAIEKNGTLFIPMHDLFGNIIALISPDNTLVESYRFSSFGEEKVPLTPQSSWRYQSKRKMTHLVYFGRRFYDPQTGRWLSPDPKGFSEGPNLYQYLLNSPHFRYDFYGEVIEASLEQLSSLLIHKPNFEQEHGYPRAYNCEYTSHEGIHELQGPAINKGALGIGITFGIKTTEERSKACLEFLLEIAGIERVEATLPPTKDLFSDITRANHSFQLIATETAYLVLERWRNFFENNSEDARYLEIPYSRGAIDVELALIMAPQEIRERIFVLAIAPAKFISSSFCGSAVNYVTTCDIVPKLQKLGFSRARSPAPAVINLDKGSPIFGGTHSFDHPIYRESLLKQISSFIKGETLLNH